MKIEKKNIDLRIQVIALSSEDGGVALHDIPQ